MILDVLINSILSIMCFYLVSRLNIFAIYLKNIYYLLLLRNCIVYFMEDFVDLIVSFKRRAFVDLSGYPSF